MTSFAGWRSVPASGMGVTMKLAIAILALMLGWSCVPLGASESVYAPAVKVVSLLTTQTDGTGRPLVAAADPEVSIVTVEFPPGAQTNWHKHSAPCFAYMLEGELSVELETGEVRTVKAGQAFAEVVDVLHNGINRGTVPARLVLFVTGEAGKAYTVRATPPAR
jgi:quercetin dioxygenase-like cupin family protein